MRRSSVLLGFCFLVICSCENRSGDASSVDMATQPPTDGVCFTSQDGVGYESRMDGCYAYIEGSRPLSKQCEEWIADENFFHTTSSRIAVAILSQAPTGLSTSRVVTTFRTVQPIEVSKFYDSSDAKKGELFVTQRILNQRYVVRLARKISEQRCQPDKLDAQKAASAADPVVQALLTSQEQLFKSFSTIVDQDCAQHVY